MCVCVSVCVGVCLYVCVEYGINIMITVWFIFNEERSLNSDYQIERVYKSQARIIIFFGSLAI